MNEKDKNTDYDVWSELSHHRREDPDDIKLTPGQAKAIVAIMVILSFALWIYLFAGDITI